MAKYLLILIILQIIQIHFSEAICSRCLAPSLLLDQLSSGNSLNELNSKGLNELNSNGSKRRKRCLSSIIALLWPQVVGPVDHMEISEPNLDDIPKTMLEHHLEHIRQKSKTDEELRTQVREFMQKFAAENPNFNFRVFALAHPELKPENPL